jgi:hypothetical protein
MFLEIIGVIFTNGRVLSGFVSFTFMIERDHVEHRHRDKPE